MTTARLFSFTIFLSAFLLFSVQPMLARAILPWFGGSAGLWNCCQFFFQAILLLGYLWAHLASTRLNARAQFRMHGGLILASLLFLPILPAASWKPGAGDDPTTRAIVTLLATVGGPYLVLSATSPLLSSWYARLLPEASPYPLYAWSNFGSLLGLLSYPFLIEPNLGIHPQAYWWSATYAVCALLLIALGYRQKSAAPLPPAHADETTSGPQALLWLLLPCLSSVLLVSMSQHISSEIASVPLLWVVPLTLYLLSFVLVASEARLYRRAVFFPALLLASLAVPEFLLNRFSLSFSMSLLSLWTCLFLFFVACHGELWRHKPPASRLSAFYLTISAGGGLGSFLVAFVFPQIFRSNYELGLALFALPIVVLLSWASDTHQSKSFAALVGGFALVAVTLGVVGHDLLELEFRPSIAELRNFYGWAHVSRDGHNGQIRRLFNGRVQHGCQDFAPGRELLATTYYGPTSGVGRLLASLKQQRPSLSVEVIGLGSGTLATYGRETDRYTMCEIDPKVVDLAKRYFTYLQKALAPTEILVEDGRLAVENSPPGKLDVLVVDAFSGDSIPFHLITREAVQAYWRALAPGGSLAFHISNPFLDLAPVLERHARDLGAQAWLCYDQPNGDLLSTSLWVIVAAKDSDFLQAGMIKLQPERDVLWTDEEINALSVIRPETLPAWLQSGH